MVEVGKKYIFSGSFVKVAKITDTHIEVKWGHNGQTPRRQCDRFIPVKRLPMFKEVVYKTRKGKRYIANTTTQEYVNYLLDTF